MVWMVRFNIVVTSRRSVLTSIIFTRFGFNGKRTSFLGPELALNITGTKGGSALSANLRAAQASIVTNLAASVGGLTWMLWVKILTNPHYISTSSQMCHDIGLSN